MAMDAKLKNLLTEISRSSHRVAFLTGSDIASESDIPFFREHESTWMVGGREYPLRKLATREMFEKYPNDIWLWYLYRRGVCRRAPLNPGHRSLVEIEGLLPDRFTLITQNSDNLHLRAGNSVKNTFEVHGNLFYMRCLEGCSSGAYPIPEGVEDHPRGGNLSDQERRLLTCPLCGGLARPHELWFDETYNEEYYHYLTVLRIARETRLLIVAGTSGSANLPVLIAQTVKRRGGVIIDINTQKTPFSFLAHDSGGFFIQETGSVALPAIYNAIREAITY
jgi:NAD-dependent protein deacetylase/lipoamidase